MSKAKISKPTPDFSSDFSRSIFYCSRHNSQGGDVAVKLDRTEVRHDQISGKPFTVFCVTVKTCCSNWTVYKRYSEFVDLHKDLTKEHEEHINQSQTSTTTQGVELAKINLPRLPPKKLIGSSLEADFVNSRRIGLQTYIRQLIRDPLLFSSKALSAFLQGKRYDAVGAIIEQYVDLKQRFHTVISYVKKLETHMRRHEHRALGKQEQLMKEIRALGTRIAELESLNGIAPKTTLVIDSAEPVADSVSLSREPSFLEPPPMSQWLTPQTQRSFSAQAALLHSAPQSSSASSTSGWRSGWRLGAQGEDPYGKNIWGWDGGSTPPTGLGEANSVRRSASSKVLRGKVRVSNDRTHRSLSESNLAELNEDALAHKHYNYRTISDQRVSPFPAPTKSGSGKYGEIGGHTTLKKDSGIHNPFGIGLNKNFYRRFMLSGGSDSLVWKDDSKGNRYGRSVSDQYGLSLSSSPDVDLGLLTGLMLEKKKETKARHDSEDSASSLKETKSEEGFENGSSSRPSVASSEPLPSSSPPPDIDLQPSPPKQVQFELASSPDPSPSPPTSESQSGLVIDSSPLLPSSHSLSTSQSMEQLALPSPQLPLDSTTSIFAAQSESQSQALTGTSLVFPEPHETPSSTPTGTTTKTIQFSLSQTSPTSSPSLTGMDDAKSFRKSPRQTSNPPLSPLGGMLSSFPSSTSYGDLRALREFYEPYLFDPELNGRVDDIIKFVQPSESSEIQFTLVLNFIRNLVNKTIGADVYAHGSYALKTYLPDADLDVSAFFSKGHENTWVQRIVQALCQEANTRATDPNLAVRSVTFVNADCKVVKAQIGRVSVDISGNQVAGLSSLGLFEEVDRVIGKDHLFKRTVLLAKTWGQNEAGILGSHKGLISSVCLRAMLLFLFNAYHQQLQTPLQAFYYLLIYLESFNWEEDALDLFGPIKLSALPSIERVQEGPTAWPEGATPCLTPELIQRYSLARVQKRKSTSSSYYPSQRRYLNVIDPSDPENNLGKTVDYKNAQKIRTAFSEGASRLRATLFEWARVKSTHRARSHSESEGEDSDRGAVSGGHYNYDRAEQTVAYRLISSLFEQTLQAYGGRMSYRFHYKDRSRPGVSTLHPPAAPSASSSSSSAHQSQHSQSSAYRKRLEQEPGSLSIPLERDMSRESNDLKTPSTNASTLEPLSPVEPPSPAPLEEDDRRKQHKATDKDVAHAHHGAGKEGEGGKDTKHNILDTDLPEVLTQLRHARQFEIPDIGDTELVRLITEVLTKHGSVPVGKMGSLLHNLVNNHSLPSMLKEKYGGLKKFLERHEPVFVLGADHPFNPHVYLRAQLSPEQLVAVTTPPHLSHKQGSSTRNSRASSRRSSTSSTSSRASNLSTYPPLSSSSNSGGLVSPTRSLSRQQRPSSAWVNVARGVSPAPHVSTEGSSLTETAQNQSRSNTTSPTPLSGSYQESFPSTGGSSTSPRRHLSPSGAWTDRDKSPSSSSQQDRNQSRTPTHSRTPTRNRRRSVPLSPSSDSGHNSSSQTSPSAEPSASTIWKKTRSKRSERSSHSKERSPKMKSKVRSPGKKNSPTRQFNKTDSEGEGYSDSRQKSRSSGTTETEAPPLARGRVTSSRPYG